VRSDSPPPSREERDLAETREVVERSERTWQRQVERERSAYPETMTPFRWVLVAIALIALAVILDRQFLGL